MYGDAVVFHLGLASENLALVGQNRFGHCEACLVQLDMY